MCHKLENRNILRIKKRKTPLNIVVYFVGADGEISPLAARPGEQHTVLFSLRYDFLRYQLFNANRSLPLAPPPSNLTIILISK